MNSRKESNIPFVGLHAHSVAGSPFDVFGYPPEHMDFAYENGMDASLLLTMEHERLSVAGSPRKEDEEGWQRVQTYFLEAYFILLLRSGRKSMKKSRTPPRRSLTMRRTTLVLL